MKTCDVSSAMSDLVPCAAATASDITTFTFHLSREGQGQVGGINEINPLLSLISIIGDIEEQSVFGFSSPITAWHWTLFHDGRGLRYLSEIVGRLRSPTVGLSLISEHCRYLRNVLPVKAWETGKVFTMRNYWWPERNCNSY